MYRDTEYRALQQSAVDDSFFSELRDAFDSSDLGQYLSERSHTHVCQYCMRPMLETTGAREYNIGELGIYSRLEQTTIRYCRKCKLETEVPTYDDNGRLDWRGRSW